MMASNENTGEKSKRRKQLVRQEAKTETEQEVVEVVEVEEVEVDSPPQCRIIYKETIDISASPSLPLSPPQSWLYGSNKYLPAQYSGNSFNSLASSRIVSPHSCSGVVWTQLSKQQSQTVETSSHCSSPTSVSGSGGLREKQKYLTKQKSLSSTGGGQTAKPSLSSPAYGSARYLPKQYSCTSNGSAYLSPQNNSCSLVDIPTYLCYPVKLATVTYDSTNTTKTDTVKTQSVPSKALKKAPSKTKWTLFCIAMGFLTVCIVLVGTMLSYTSAYQDREVARNMFYNVVNTTNY